MERRVCQSTLRRFHPPCSVKCGFVRRGAAAADQRDDGGKPWNAERVHGRGSTILDNGLPARLRLAREREGSRTFCAAGRCDLAAWLICPSRSFA
jgi:hypothetical protein